MLSEEPKHVRKLRTGHASNAHNLADLAVITTTRIHDLSDRVSTCPVRVFPILGLSSFAPQTAEKISAPGRSAPGRALRTGGGSGSWGHETYQRARKRKRKKEEGRDQRRRKEEERGRGRGREEEERRERKRRPEEERQEEEVWGSHGPRSRDYKRRGGQAMQVAGNRSRWAEMGTKKRPGKGPGRKRDRNPAGAGQAPGKPETVRTTRRTRRCRP